MKSSIRTKILLGCTGLLLVVLICQLVFGIFLSRRFVLWRTEKVMNTLYLDLVQSYDDEPDKIYERTESAENNYRVNIMITDGDKLIYANRQSDKGFFMHSPLPSTPENPTAEAPTDFGEAPKPSFDPQPELSSEKNGGFFGSVEDFSSTPSIEQIQPKRQDDSSEMLLLRGKTEYNGEERYIAIWVAMESIDSVVSVFTQVNLTISVVVLLLGLIVSYFIAKSITKPIKNVEHISQQIAELDFAQKADESVSTKELAGLAHSINSMATQLRQSFDELQLANSRLAEDIDRERQVEKMRREFIANVSHEMKTPLCLLQMYSENLKEDVDGIDREYYCQTIIDETARLNEMVKSMLDISNVENGLSSLNMEPLDYSSLVSYTVSKLSILAEEQALTVSIDEGIAVNGDRHYLEQAIKNYVTNAITHTEAGRRIDISLTRQPSSAVFSVFNEGKTIDPEKLPHIWESFYKTDEARVRKDGVHAGLGLYIVRIIAEKHGGSCIAENVDGGVLFTLILPVSPQESTQQEAE
ncbi:MAG TPA: hypothetical protein DDY98_02810 [Ruminococcaceae bacterium]|nr:hypothetical protein [Oscillospiraceae bacterium]